MTESRVVASITRALERSDCIVVKMHGSAFSRAGFPDLLVIRPDGVTCYLEVKQPGRTDGPAGNGLSALQVRWLRRLQDRGARAGVACTAGEAAAVVFGE